MKVVRLPTKNKGDWWTIVHDLTVHEGRLRNLRPINILTFLGQVRAKGLKKNPFHLCMALENKLFGVRLHLQEFSKAVAPIIDQIYSGHYVREYGGTQVVICALEAYLNSIYTSLEMCSQINKIFHDKLPIGFRKQAKKYKIFNFKNWEWLPCFYDLRSELTHFNTPLPRIKEQKIFIEFTSSKKLEVFKKGKYEITFDLIKSFAPGLFNLLDTWALKELKLVDPDTKIAIIKETGWKKPLKTEKRKAKEILDLIKKP